MKSMTVIQAFKALEEIDDSVIEITPKETKKRVIKESLNEATNDYYCLSDGKNPRRSKIYAEIDNLDDFIAKLEAGKFDEYWELLHYVNGDAKKVWSTKEGKIEESCSVEEDTKRDLHPRFDSRQSFYGKARVVTRDDGSEILYSYGYPVCQIKDGKPYLLYHVDSYASYNSSQTTLRHVKEFLKQHGFKADSLKQIEKDYEIQKGSLKEDYNDLNDSWDSICGDIITKVKEVLGKDIKDSDIHYDESRAYALYVFGDKLDLPVYKFGAYRNYLGGGMRGPIEHNGREQEGTVELGEFFAKQLERIEDLIAVEYDEEDEHEVEVPWGGTEKRELPSDYTKDESLTESTTVDLNDKDAVKEVKDALEKDEKDTSTEQIVDVDAETIDKVKDSYIGNAVLRCTKCKTPFFRKPEDLNKDEASELFNVGEECPHCGNDEGFELVGQIASMNIGEAKPEESTGADENASTEEKSTEEETPAGEVKTVKKTTEVEVEEEPGKLESLKTVENLDESGFDKVINEYLKETFENVESYTTTKGVIIDESLELEGTIKYTSGKEKPIKFVLEGALTKGNKIKFTGMNESLTDAKKAFTFISNIKDNCLVCEALSYNYQVKVNEENKVVRGRHFLKK